MFWQSDDSEACVRVSHDNGYVDSCYYIYNYTKRIIHVHGVTGPIRILARVENRRLEKSVVGEEKALNLYLYDSSGNSKGELKDEALFHPESGSLPLVYTGNLSSAMSIIPKPEFFQWSPSSQHQQETWRRSHTHLSILSE